MSANVPLIPTVSLTHPGAIIAILISLRDQPLAKWSLGLTSITILSKIASAALILPISEAIGQLKWTWFHGKESKDAFDFEIFDKASRGAWGSFLLLCRTKGRSLAALGALLTVLLLAIDTFFQQVTDLPVRWTLHGTGLVPRVVQYKPDYVQEFVNGYELAIADKNSRALAETFFVANGTQSVPFGNGTRPDIPLSCPTSSCIWPAYETLGMCSQCAETPHLLTYACLDTRVDWTSKLNATVLSYPNATVCGHFLNATSEDPILMSGYVRGPTGQPDGETLIMRTVPLFTNPLRHPLWGGSVNFKHIRNPIIDVLISSNTNRAQVHANATPQLLECMLTWCVKTVESSYWFGTYHETVTTTYTNNSANGSPWSTILYEDGWNDQTYLENVTISAVSANSTSPDVIFGLKNGTMLSTVLAFDPLFPAFTTVTNDSTDALLRWRIGHPTEVRTRVLTTNPWLLPNNVTQHMERLATAFTNLVRSDSSSNEFVPGSAYVAETYVAVHWAWLSFPLVMLGLSIVFLAATIVKTSKGADGGIGMWKTSAMPTLIYSLPQNARQDLTPSSTWQSTKSAKAKKVKIRLVPDQGWRVSGQVCTSPTLLRRSFPSAPPGWL